MAAAANLAPKSSGPRPKPPAPGPKPIAPARESVPKAAAPALPAYARGHPLDSGVRQKFEARFQRDLSAVRIHPDSPDKIDSVAKGARAVTIGNEIWFGPGQYNPQSDEGQELIAHELTHVVQQEGASGTVMARMGSTNDRFETEARRNAQAAQSGGPLAVRERSGQAGPQPDEEDHGFWYKLLIRVFPEIQPILDRGIVNWIQDRVLDAVQAIIAAVMAPVRAISGIATSLSTHFTQLVSWIKKAAASIAKGDCSVLKEAVDYIEEAVKGLIAPILDKIKEVAQKIGAFFSGLWDKFGAPIWNEMKRIGGWAWDKIKEFGEWIWTKTKPIRDVAARAWTWFKNLLGIGEGPEGQNGLLQWVEEKAEKAWDWLKPKIEPIKKPLLVIGGILVMLSPAGPVIAVGLAVGGIIEGVRVIKRYFGTRDGVVSGRVILQTVVLPKLIQVIKGFAALLSGKANGLIGAIRRARDTVRQAAHAAAESIFSFLTGMLDWIADAVDDFAKWGDGVVADFLDWVDRTTAGLAGFLDRVLNVLDHIAQVVHDIMKLPFLLANKIWSAIPACIRDPFVDFFGVQILGRIAIFKAIAGTPEAWAKTKNDVGAIIKTFFIDFDLIGAMKKAFLLMLRALDVPLELLEAVIGKMVQAWDIIKEKPVEFLKNLFRTIMLALRGFFSRILIHLRNGLVGWLTKSLQGANLRWPSSWTNLGELFAFVLSILGLSINHVFERLALKISPDKVQLLRRAMNFLTGAWEWLSLIVKGDYQGFWEKAKEKVSDVWNMVMQGIIDWLMKEVVEGVMQQLVTTADPTGISEVIMFLIDLYRTIKTAVQYMRQILTMMNRMLDSIIGIATGVLQGAADLIEEAMDKGMPVVIGFLANLVGLGDVGEGIRGAIDNVRAKVDEGIDWLIDKGIAFIDAVVGAVKSAVAAVVEWWKQKFSTKVGDEKHTVLWQGEGEDAELSIQSDLMPLRAFLNDLETKPQARKPVIQQIRTLLDQIATLKRQRGKTPEEIGNQIEPVVNQIVALLPNAAKSVNALPPTVIKINTTRSIPGRGPDGKPAGGGCTVGEHMLAEPLCLTPPTNGWTGSEPGEGNEFFKKVNQRKWTYIQGHLLNHNIHGPGIDENLVPIHRKLNTGMVGPVENEIKTRVRDKHIVVSYDVTVKFGKWPDPPYTHIPEENDLPLGMSFAAWEMKLKTPDADPIEPDSWVKDTQIGVPAFMDNYRGPDAPPDVRVRTLKGVGLNARGPKAAEAFEEVFYFGPAKANDLSNESKTFSNFQQVIDALGLPGDSREQWKAHEPPVVSLNGPIEWA